MEKLKEDVTDIVALLLDEKKYADLKAILITMNAPDIAILMEELPEPRVPAAFRLLPKELAAETFVEMSPDSQELLVRAFTDVELHAILDEMYLDDAVDMIEELPANLVTRILRNADPKVRVAINELLKYPADSAGSIMTIEYVDLKRDMTVEQAFARIRKTGVDKETIYTCYVTDRNRVLLGIVTGKTLLLSEPNTIVGDIMETNIISVDTSEDKEVVAHQFDKYNFLALPVVDGENRLVGIITVDDAMDVLQDENTEDFSKMAAITPSEDSYFHTSVFTHAKNRILWLLILMLSSTVSGMIISKYEKAFSALPLLVSFLPMLMDTGGNCGAQSSTMIIRGLALDEIRPRDFFKAVFKEIRIALLCAAVLCIVNAARIMVFYHDFRMVIITCSTLMCTVTLAKSLGCCLPMLAKLLKLDPAIMASPLITTIVDACSVLLYFNIATRVLSL